MTVAARYQKLLDEFRNAHAQFSESLFSLSVCHWVDLPKIDLKHRRSWDQYLKSCVERIETLPGEIVPAGVVGFPCIAENWLLTGGVRDPFTDETDARRYGDELMKCVWRMCPVYSRARNATDHRAAAKFRELAEKAAKDLPLCIRNSIPKQSVVDPEPRRYCDRWLTLMFWSNPPNLEKIISLNQFSQGCELFWQPFSNSADIIERCQLTTDSPKFVPKDSSWPRWAGQIPPSLLRVDHKPAANSVTVEPPKTKQQSTEPAAGGSGNPEGMPSGEHRNLMERVIWSIGENGITTATLKKSGLRIAFLMKPRQNYNAQLRKTLRLLRLPPHELLSPSSGHGYFLNSRGVAVYEQLKKDRLEESLKKKKSH